MTTEKKEIKATIVAGPNELQMMMSLMHPGADTPFNIDMGRGTSVQFTIEREGLPNIEIHASIQSIQREDGSGHKWNIGGYVFDRKPIRAFNAYYNSKTRKGVMTLETYS